MKNFEDVITRIIKHRFVCSECDGSGVIRKEVRKMVYMPKCPKCDGLGYIDNFIRTEISLQEALNGLKIAQ